MGSTTALVYEPDPQVQQTTCAVDKSGVMPMPTGQPEPSITYLLPDTTPYVYQPDAQVQQTMFAGDKSGVLPTRNSLKRKNTFDYIDFEDQVPKKMKFCTIL